jgi:hypothetical protein
MLVYDIVLRMGKQRVSMTAAELQAAGRAVRLTGGPRWPAAGVFRWGPRGYLTPCSGGPAWAGGGGKIAVAEVAAAPPARDFCGALRSRKWIFWLE